MHTERDSPMTTAPQTVRLFSISGPCLMLGRLIRETPRFYVYLDGGQERRITKSRAHVQPCHCCRGGSNYPDQYWD